MSQGQQTIPPHPVVAIEINDTAILVNGTQIAFRDEADPYRVAAHAVARTVARDLGRPVRAVATDSDSRTNLVIHPDGSTSDVETVELDADADYAHLEDLVNAPAAPDAPTVEDAPTFLGWAPEPQPEPVLVEAPAAAGPAPESEVVPEREREALPAEVTAAVELEPEPSTSAEPLPSRARTVETQGRHSSFVRREVPISPAEEGWRGALNRMGLRLAPSSNEMQIRTERDAVSEFYVDSRTVAVANPKGGSSKTPSTALLAAVFASGRGGNVLAFDLNETRGSLGWRTQQGRHSQTVLDLLPQVERLSAIETQAASLAGFTHHQLADKYDVLQSDQSVAGEHEMSADDVARVHQLVSRFWGLVVCDSGNSERAENWRAMIERADALVVPCTNSADTAEGAALMLEALRTRDEHSRELASRAVVIVSQRDRNTKQVRTEMKEIVAGMQDLAAEVVTIPFDPAMQEGVLHFKALRPATKRAWLRAGAAVARAL